MIFYKTKEKTEETNISYINIDIIGNKLVYNETGKLPNDIYEFNNYNDMLSRVSKSVNQFELNRIKEFLENNCIQIKLLMNKIDNKGQISLF